MEEREWGKNEERREKKLTEVDWLGDNSMQ
jgi:hypothetical protein